MKTGLRLQVLVISLTRIVYNTMHRMVYPYLGAFSQGLGVGLPQMSRALALRSVAGGFSPLLAFLADSRGRKTGMLSGLVLIAVAAAGLAVRPVFPVFVLGLVLATVGYHVFVPSMQAYLGDQVPYRQRGLVMALTEIGWSLSFILGVPLMGYLIVHYGWASPFPILALLAAISLLVLGFILPADRLAPQEHAGGIRHSLQLILASPAAWAGLALSILMTSANENVNLVFGLWLFDSFGLQVTALGMVAIGIGLAEFGGEVLVGALVDRLGKVNAIAVGLVLNCIVSLGMILVGRSPFAAVGLLLCFYLTFEFTLVSSLPLMTELLPAARASLMAVNIASFALGRAVGAGLGGWLYSRSAQLFSGVALNAAAAVFFNLAALISLACLHRWWVGAEKG